MPPPCPPVAQGIAVSVVASLGPVGSHMPPPCPPPAQGIAVSVVASLGQLKNPEDGKAVQNFMICVEMLGASIMMLFAFPVSDFNVGGQHAVLRASNMVHAISIRDVFADTIHQVRTCARRCSPFGRSHFPKYNSRST